MLFSSAAFLLLISISHVSSHPKPHIAEAGGGTATTSNQYPFMVRVDAVDDIFVDPDTNKIAPFTGRICGATLIPAYGRTEESDIVLTAAHCMAEAEPGKDERGQLTLEVSSKPIPVSKRRLVAGAHSISSLTEPGSQVRKIARMVFHPKWSVKMAEGHDIAIIQLDKPIKFSETIKSTALPEKGDRPSDPCVIAGWGRINSKQSSKVLYHMTVTVKDECKHSGETGLCVDAGGSSIPTACGGDSGGPLFCKRKNEWVQYGLLSYGRGTCEKTIVNTPSVYMNIEVYLDWINEKVREWSSVSSDGK